ncbi:MAG: hypothetical protein K0U54_01220 [Bacteroidetes bacterium]|nr:hypothetical protein [Bacteroidota bacterium]
MPIEIRELVIKTEIRSSQPSDMTEIPRDELRKIKKQLLQECKKLIIEHTRRSAYKR